jgi:pyrroline-5-carboxylate reductase
MTERSIPSTCFGVIGVGVMGEALLATLKRAGAKNICFAEKREQRAEEISKTHGAVLRSIADIGANCEVILLVTKPQDLEEALLELRSQINPSSLVISFVAGKKIGFISEKIGSANVIRVMPNTPTLIGEGISAISGAPGVDPRELHFVEEILTIAGKTVEVPEALQDAVTALSGSGPAYFYAFTESMIDAGTKLGLSLADATLLAHQTFVGAAKLLEKTGESATQLRKNVTSPNGTTAAALKVFEAGGLETLIAKAMIAARDRSVELG